VGGVGVLGPSVALAHIAILPYMNLLGPPPDTGLDVLVSWNFRHISNVRRADRFNALAVLDGFLKPLRIVSPAEVLYDDQPEEA
jgi:hypothetical protein